MRMNIETRPIIEDVENRDGKYIYTYLYKRYSINLLTED